MRGTRPLPCQAVAGLRRSVEPSAVSSEPGQRVRLSYSRCGRMHPGVQARRRVACTIHS